MGCNCGGSQTPATAANVERANIAREDRQLAPPPVFRQGGPGEPGYVWNGPETNPAPAEPTPAE